MSWRLLSEIRGAVVNGDYDLTSHAVDEMAEDYLDIIDVEVVLLSGDIHKIETDDPRGTRYTLIGLCSVGKRLVGVVGRFKETGVFLVITVYEVT